MKTKNTSREPLLVWTIIVSLFAMLTVVSVNFDRIRNSSVLNREHRNIKLFPFGSSEDKLLNQQSYSVVLVQ